MTEPIATGPIACIEELTPEWLTAVLRGADLLTGTEVVALTTQRVGSGQLGTCYRVVPTYEGPVGDGPASLVVKLPSLDEGSRAFAAHYELYRREVSFYRDAAAQVDIRVPRSIHAAVSGDGRIFDLLVEDLSPAAECNQIEGCTLQQTDRALEQAALLHASSWNNDRLRRLPWILGGLTGWRTYVASATEAQQAFRALYGKDLEEEYLVIGDRLAEGGAAAWAAGFQNGRCLGHGDFRVDNMLFDGRNGEVPLAVVDWQSVSLCRGTADASYFLGGSVPTDVRREHEDALMRRYHAMLQDQGVVDYSWDDCWTDYRMDAVQGFMVTVLASIAVERTTRGDQMFLTMARRHGSHILDHGSLPLLTQSSGR